MNALPWLLIPTAGLLVLDRALPDPLATVLLLAGLLIAGTVWRRASQLPIRIITGALAALLLLDLAAHVTLAPWIRIQL